METTRAGLVVSMAFALVCGLASVAQAGGSMDEDSPDPAAGPSYFGFVKDTNGSLIPDAKVSAELKGRGTIVTRSDLLGVYRVPGFGKEINPDDVTITCAKDGYKPARTLRKPSNDPAAPVETECVLQRQ